MSRRRDVTFSARALNDVSEGERPAADEENMELRARRVLVVGLAKSGEAAAELLLSRGASVTVNDKRSREALGEVATRLQHLGAKLALGEHSEALFLAHELIVVSPGVPRTLPALCAAQAAGIEIIGELELASRFLDVPMVAITGTNGKSTTTTFTGHFLHASGKRVFVGGNLGTPLCRAVDQDPDLVVVEVSSFQLEWAPTFKPKVALILNITEDHLDRYRDFEDYGQTKGLIFKHQDEHDFAVVNQADPFCLRLAQAGRAPVHTFGFGADVQQGMRFLDEQLQLGSGEHWQPIPLEGFKPRGRHNLENLMAAFLGAHLAGMPVKTLEPLIPRLEGLPHRLELVRELDGVRYYNDSKATNVASVQCSLRDMTEPLVLLMGGRDKGGSYAPLEPIVSSRVRSLVVFGEASPLIKAALGHLTHLVEVQDVREAVMAAQRLAHPGDSVVLSPACSSYDQFPNYEVRGETFKKLVRALASSQHNP